MDSASSSSSSSSSLLSWVAHRGVSSRRWRPTRWYLSLFSRVMPREKEEEEEKELMRSGLKWAPVVTLGSLFVSLFFFFLYISMLFFYWYRRRRDETRREETPVYSDFLLGLSARDWNKRSKQQTKEKEMRGVAARSRSSSREAEIRSEAIHVFLPFFLSFCSFVRSLFIIFSSLPLSPRP